MASAPTAAAVVSVARSQIGVKESPAGSNKVKYSAWYGMVGPWCAMFVSWCAAQAKATTIIPKHAYTPSGAAWFKSRGQWYSRGKVGDIIYFQWPGMGRISHVGIVEAVHSDGSYTTIEGNTDSAGGRTGGRVMRQRRSRYISGFGRPKYGSGVTPPRPPTPKPEPKEIEMNGIVLCDDLSAQFYFDGTSLIWLENNAHKNDMNYVYRKVSGGKNLPETTLGDKGPIEAGHFGYLAENAPDPTTAGVEKGWDFSKHRKSYAKP